MIIILNYCLWLPSSQHQWFGYWLHVQWRDRRGRDRMIVGFTTTYAISDYHHWCCEFESRSERVIQHYVIKFVSDLRQVGGFLHVLRFPPPMKLTPGYSCNIVESGVEHHKLNHIFNPFESHRRVTVNVLASCPEDRGFGSNERLSNRHLLIFSKTLQSKTKDVIVSESG